MGRKGRIAREPSSDDEPRNAQRRRRFHGKQEVGGSTSSGVHEEVNAEGAVRIGPPHMNDVRRREDSSHSSTSTSTDASTSDDENDANEQAQPAEGNTMEIGANA